MRWAANSSELVQRLRRTELEYFRGWEAWAEKTTWPSKISVKGPIVREHLKAAGPGFAERPTKAIKGP